MIDYEMRIAQEIALHKILNDTSGKITFLDIHELAIEVSKINFALSLIENTPIPNFNVALRQYKNNLIAHIESI